MGLNDEIGNFSKRREVEVVTKRHDAYEEEDDDWDDDESKYDSFDFKMYELDDLGKFNSEVQELERLITPWWKNLKILLSKPTLGKIGLVDIKKKHLLSDDTFENIQIEEVEESLAELSIFKGILNKSYQRHFKFNIYGLLTYIPFIYWSGWSTIWYFLLAWSLFDMGLRYFKYDKQKNGLLRLNCL
jgi:hypothetical protein